MTKITDKELDKILSGYEIDVDISENYVKNLVNKITLEKQEPYIIFEKQGLINQIKMLCGFDLKAKISKWLFIPSGGLVAAAFLGFIVGTTPQIKSVQAETLLDVAFYSESIASAEDNFWLEEGNIE